MPADLHRPLTKSCTSLPLVYCGEESVHIGLKGADAARSLFGTAWAQLTFFRYPYIDMLLDVIGVLNLTSEEK